MKSQQWTSSSMEQFYADHLSRVSRSFAYCIGRLEGEFKTWVSSSYLICRVLDTIEDAPWRDSSKQDEAYKKFFSFLKEYQDDIQQNDWSPLFPDQILPGEKKLIRESNILFKDFHRFPDKVKSIISQMVTSMAQGMKHFSGPQEQKRKEQGLASVAMQTIQIKGLKELNQYCFFVAGVVGELLSRLLQVTESQFSMNKNSFLNSYHFGLFLQKINLLKDQRVDESEGRFFIYNRLNVYESLEHHCGAVLDYIESIPLRQRSYRLFCAWSAFLGLASLPWIERSYVKKDPSHKISRFETKTLFFLVESLIDNPQRLRIFYTSLANKAGLNLNDNNIAEGQKINPIKDDSLDWITDSYKGDFLNPENMALLGMA